MYAAAPRIIPIAVPALVIAGRTVGVDVGPDVDDLPRDVHRLGKGDTPPLQPRLQILAGDQCRR